MSADTSPGPTALTTPQVPGLVGEGLMVYVVDVDDVDEARFEAWYTHEHMPERVGTPGFRRGRRYRRRDRDAPGQHLTVYEVDHTDVFTSPEYLRRLDHPTPLTREVVARFRDPRRVVLAVVSSHGASSGRELSLLRTGADVGLGDRVTDLLPQLLTDPRLTGVHVAVSDLAATAAKSATAEGRGADEPEAAAEAVLLVEGVAGTTAAAETVAAQCRLPASDVATYDLVVTLDRHSLDRA